ncbi:MAG: ATP-dependent helicase HrpB [Planctomycetes bacterium]|nr:ATP-dependent helicase HrpB [Planctomycetota bacterium]MCB9918326.1 ATP-dependent helicase HrpB [Planctomycetota bacterium]
MRARLPIDSSVPEIVAALRATGAVVVTATPGSGKTTRVPLAILEDLESTDEAGAVWVLEPRRIAARAAARRVAAERPCRVGDDVGYIVRHDRASSKQTRLVFVTEGVLVAAITRDPELPGISTVVLDELHERHVETDLALAMLRDVRTTLRPDLRLVAMSATLDAEKVAEYLSASHIEVPGALHEITTVWDEGHDDRTLELRIAAACREAIEWFDAQGEDNAGVLVFVPGVREIEAAIRTIEADPSLRSTVALPLHGRLDAATQDDAIRESHARKIVVSTNLAESSITVDGIRAVVDSGLARVLRRDPRTGFDRLRLETISIAAADQRRGRAGRLGPGLCRRLWVRGEERLRKRFDDPELGRVDVTRAWLDVRTFAGRDADSFSWFEAPPRDELTSADTLLQRLGAIDVSGRITKRGRAMQALPLSPRLARLILEARTRGCVLEAAAIAAILQAGTTKRDDLLAAAHDVVAGRIRGKDAGAIRRTTAQLARNAVAGTADDGAWISCLLAAFPDHVAKRSSPSAEEAWLANGTRLDLRSVLRGEANQLGDRTLFLALDLHGLESKSPRPAYVLAIDESMLPAELVEDTKTILVDPATARVRRVRKRTYGTLTLEETTLGDASLEEARPLWIALLEKDAGRWLNKQTGLADIRARIAWLSSRGQEDLPDLSDVALAPWIVDFVDVRSGLAGLASLDLGVQLLASKPDLRHRLARDAPPDVQLPVGRRAAIDYSREVGPTVTARVQELFGCKALPALCGGSVPLVIEILGPNHRPVQLTQDLDGFWTRTYPSVRADLRRRYPKHAWPEDPRSATPEQRPRRRNP